ncbi:hypothetical protein M8J76_010784 [Diaphorina citri]|nr:hypothetical protein M8J76_010784 [Diaphorina citri]KAI5735327.1 hypothetical protein M8J77_017044 [Diaphorina citri]
MTDLPVAIKKVDMTKKMQAYVIRAAKVAFEKCTSQEEIAAYLKNRFNRRYEPMWTCIVGTNFGAYVSYESRRFIYFYLGQTGVLLFRNGSILHDIQMYLKSSAEAKAKGPRKRKLRPDCKFALAGGPKKEKDEKKEDEEEEEEKE